jgi:hypothetical protein
MTLEERRERAILRRELNNLLTKCDNDMQYFRRLTWALEFISNNIDRFDIMIDDRCNILVEGDKD